jgi:hypothetical protein
LVVVLASTGVERNELNGDVVALIVFDPSCDEASLRANLSKENSVWKRQLCKELSSITKSCYQIVYIAPGIMDCKERERSKTIVGQSDTSPLKCYL